MITANRTAFGFSGKCFATLFLFFIFFFFQHSAYAECLACTQQARAGQSGVTPFPQCCGDYPPDASNPTVCGAVTLALADFDGDNIPDVLESKTSDFDNDGFPDIADADSLDPCVPDPQAEACINPVNVPFPFWALLSGFLVLMGIGYRKLQFKKGKTLAGSAA